MLKHRAIILASVLQITLGNICMANSAYKQESAQPVMHHEAMEMVMSPVLPMSPSHCHSCVRVEIRQATPFTLPCHNGHCVSHHPSAETEGIPIKHSLIAVVLPLVQHTRIQQEHLSRVRDEILIPPITQQHTKTIVLLN